MNGFEGSFLGNKARIDTETVLECGVCWWVYDPQRGDNVWQIPAGTAFNALPGHWRCPNCDARQDQFMVVKDEPRTARRIAAGEQCEGERNLQNLQESLVRAYEQADERMRALPVHNSALAIDVTGLRRCEGGHAAIVSTPWCMNIVFIPSEVERVSEGTTREHSFPSGAYPMVRGYLEGLGAIESCSLFSPMDEFESPEAVSAVAEEVANALFTASPDTTPEEDVDMDRRRFLGASQRKNPSLGSADEAAGAAERPGAR